MRILGVDPGLYITGWGIIETTNGQQLHHVSHGFIQTTRSESIAQRLNTLFNQLSRLIQTYRPLEAAVEEIFVNKNAASTLKLGLARGMALLAPAQAGLPVYEYGANLVKKSVVGTGHANKMQVAMMVERLLTPAGAAGINAEQDAADALAVAISHAHFRFSPFFQRER